MDTENKSRTDLALPNPQEASSMPGIEVLEASPRDRALPENPVSPPPPQTWRTFLKRELEFLGATQILVGLVCLCFGTIACSTFHISDFDDEVALLSRAVCSFWGAVLFVLSGFLSIMSERKNTRYLVRGSLGANLVSSVVAGLGIVILILSLSNSSAHVNYCKALNTDDDCFIASFITEMASMMLFLTILAFFSAVLLTVYGIGEEFKSNKVTDDRLYEELNIYSPIYSVLDDKQEATSPVDL